MLTGREAWDRAQEADALRLAALAASRASAIRGNAHR